MTITYADRTVLIDGYAVDMDWPVLDAFEDDQGAIVLLDPNAYLADPDYRRSRKLGRPPVQNLLAITRLGARRWEAELPTATDYYYSIASRVPLVANSFSSYRCEVSADNGTILSRQFVK
jgi:hypothetical protein